MHERRRYSTVDDAFAFAQFAHSGMKDKAGVNYIEHPLRVAAYVRAWGAPPHVRCAALLHDVLEDTVVTAQMLLDLGFSPVTVEIVLLLTRTPQVQSDDYYRAIRGHPDALMVKLADIEDNSQEWRLASLDSQVQVRLRKKYAHARDILLS